MEIWTFHHIVAPGNRQQAMEGESKALSFFLLDFIALPRGRGPDATNRKVFSLFYSAVTTFPFVVSYFYWLVLDGQRGFAVGSGPFRAWIIFSMVGVNSIIALLEILLMSSVPKQSVPHPL